MPDLMQKVDEFVKSLPNGGRQEGVVYEWEIVPEGYSPKKTIRGFFKFLFLGERDPKKLYDKLPTQEFYQPNQNYN